MQRKTLLTSEWVALGWCLLLIVGFVAIAEWKKWTLGKVEWEPPQKSLATKRLKKKRPPDYSPNGYFSSLP
jgi:hypothetical protein